MATKKKDDDIVDSNESIGLENIIEEFSGMKELIIGNSVLMFQLLCKLEGLMLLTNEEDFALFRRTIFECLTLVSNLKKKICMD